MSRDARLIKYKITHCGLASVLSLSREIYLVLLHSIALHLARVRPSEVFHVTIGDDADRGLHVLDTEVDAISLRSQFDSSGRVVVESLNLFFGKRFEAEDLGFPGRDIHESLEVSSYSLLNACTYMRMSESRDKE